MTDRREAVARAIYRVRFGVPTRGNDRWDDPTLFSGVKDVAYQCADAALAAIAATEPTEAEIEAAAEAIWGAMALPNRFNPPLRWSDKTAPEQERYRSCARAAFYADRKAGQA